MAEDLGLTVNEKKSIITPFKNHGFVFLKLKFRLLENGKIVTTVSHKKICAIKRKLSIFRKRLDKNTMDFDGVFQSYNSIRAHIQKYEYNSSKLRRLDRFFIRLFNKELKIYPYRLKCTFLAIHANNKLIYKEKVCHISTLCITA
jgi:hypothetical protein